MVDRGCSSLSGYDARRRLDLFRTKSGMRAVAQDTNAPVRRILHDPKPEFAQADRDPAYDMICHARPQHAALNSRLPISISYAPLGT